MSWYKRSQELHVVEDIDQCQHCERHPGQATPIAAHPLQQGITSQPGRHPKAVPQRHGYMCSLLLISQPCAARSLGA